jgi:DNA-directed RNA polymerase specialized sigma24 family protein
MLLHTEFCEDLNMTPILVQEAEELHHALAGKEPSIKVSLSRNTAELVARVIDAKVEGKEILVARGFQEVSPTETATILGMSRPQVRKIMESCFARGAFLEDP